MKRILFVLIFLSTLIFSRQSFASHLMGGDITWQCIGTDSYLVTMTIFRDCNGIPLATQDITVRDCNLDSINTGTSAKKIFARDITPVCTKSCTRCGKSRNQAPGNTSCKFPYGIEMFVFQQIIVFNKTNNPSNCCKFYLGKQDCCRNGAITTGAGNGGNGFLIESELDRCQGKGDNSPVFAFPPVMILPVNQPVFLQFHGIDNDIDKNGNRDSLAYKLYWPRQYRDSPNTATIVYTDWTSPFSYDKPLKFDSFPNKNALWNPPSYAGFHFDSISGALYFMPVELTQTIIGVEVDEYRKDTLGVYHNIGTVRRDIQLIVMLDSANNPPELSGIDSSVKTDTVIHPGSTMCFSVYGNDKDITDSVHTGCVSELLTNGATAKTDSSKLHSFTTFCWTPTIKDISTYPHQVIFYAYDNHCPLRGRTYKSFNIFVKPDIEDTINVSNNCGDVTFSVQPKIGSAPIVSYTWTGDDSLSSSSAKFSHRYSKSGRYKYSLKTSNLKFGLNSTDTGSIVVVNTNGPLAAPSVNSVGTDSLRCSVTSDYYLWYLNGIKIKDNTQQILAGASGKYQVQIMDTNGCTSPFSGIVTAISNEVNSHTIHIYPNPTTGILTIETPGIKDAQISLMNITGQVQFQSLINERAELDLHTLAKGIYLLRIQSKDGVMMRQVIKQ